MDMLNLIENISLIAVVISGVIGMISLFLYEPVVENAPILSKITIIVVACIVLLLVADQRLRSCPLLDSQLSFIARNFCTAMMFLLLASFRYRHRER